MSALDVRAKEINEEMKLAAVYAIAGLISDDELHANYVIPDPFDPRVAAHVASVVAYAANRGRSKDCYLKAEMKNGQIRMDTDMQAVSIPFFI